MSVCAIGRVVAAEGKHRGGAVASGLRYGQEGVGIPTCRFAPFPTCPAAPPRHTEAQTAVSRDFAVTPTPAQGPCP